MAIGPVTGHLFSMAIDPAIGHVRTCHSHGAKVTVFARISTTVQLVVKCSSNLATVGRTMIEVSLTQPDHFCHSPVLKITVGHRPISVQKLGGAEIRDYSRPSCPSTKWPTTLSINEGTKCERPHSLFLCSGSVEYR